LSQGNYTKYISFIKRYPEFVYKSFFWEANTNYIDYSFHFIIPGLAEFRPKTRLYFNKAFNPVNLPEGFIDNVVFNIGLVELISYWKTTCSQTSNIMAGSLSLAQIEFWKKLLFHGLGEFFFLNNIVPDFETFVNIKNPKTRFCIVDDSQVTVMLTDDEKVHPNYDLAVWMNSPFFSNTLKSTIN